MPTLLRCKTIFQRQWRIIKVTPLETPVAGVGHAWRMSNMAAMQIYA